MSTYERENSTRLLVRPCLACNREAYEPMCVLCGELEDAEERAEEETHDGDYRD